MADYEEQNTQEGGEARVYELSFHILPTVGEEEVASRIADIRDAIETRGGTIHKEEQPQFMTLAYSMEVKRESKSETYESAYFGWIVFTAPPEQAPAIEQQVKNRPDILRCMVIKTDLSQTEAPKGPVQAQEGSPQESTSSSSEQTQSNASIDEAIEELVS